MRAKKIKKMNGESIYVEKGSPIIGCSKEFLDSPLAFISKVHARNEPIVDINIPLMSMAMVCDADLINEVLNDKGENFRKSDRDVSILSGLLGHGLVTSNGEDHKNKKKRILPAFKFKWFDSYLEKANLEASNYATSIRPGVYVSFPEDMVRITFMTNMRILFGDEIINVDGGVNQVNLIIDELSKILMQRLTGIYLPQWMPTRKNRLVANLQRLLQESIDSLIRDRLNNIDSCEGRADILSMLICEIENQGEEVDIDSIRGELLTVFIAGYETTASTLMWVFYHLGKNKDILHKVQHEIDSIDSGLELSFDECQSMEYTDMVIKETMRLNPAIWVVVDRQANHDVQVGEYVIPKDQNLFLSTYGVHKNPKYFANPDVFDPERFNEANKGNIKKGSYFPFGMGKRICIGAGLSVVIIKSVMFRLLKQFDIEVDPDQVMEEEALLSLKSKYGLRLRFKER